MKQKILALCVILYNIFCFNSITSVVPVSYATAFSLNVGHGINFSDNYKTPKICLLNYNNVYSSFYDWSNNDKSSHQKIINNTLWLSKNRFITPSVVIGIYNKQTDLNYVCLLRKTGPRRFKILNIFANPSNDLDDDNLFFDNLLNFCTLHEYTLDVENLKIIEDNRYYLSYLYKYRDIYSNFH
jgi:hypothetical protein